MNSVAIWWLYFTHLNFYTFAISDCIELLTENNLALLCPAYRGSLPPPNPGAKKYSKLQIESAIFPQIDVFLTRQNFTTLQSLTYLRIVSSGLDHINQDTFIDLKQLLDLDLSKNRLTYIEPGTFRGLKLNKLILSGNPGLQMPSDAFLGAVIYTFVARDCGIREISHTLFESTKTKHINLANNEIKTLSANFVQIIISAKETSPHTYAKELNWGSIDLSNNSLHCDCRLLWLAKILERQQKAAEEHLSNSNVDLKYKLGPRLSRNQRTTSAVEPMVIYEDRVKPMYQMNITCKSPAGLGTKRFPLPSQLDCPSPHITGIDIEMIGPSVDSIQLTCHASGRPTPNVAWAFKHHSQEFHRIIKSPEIENNKRFQALTVSQDIETEEATKIDLNVSLAEFSSREFSCIAWAGFNERIVHSSFIDRLSEKLLDHNKFSDDSSRQLRELLSHSVNPKLTDDAIIQDQAHRVFVRLRGPKFSSNANNPNVEKNYSFDNFSKLPEDDSSIGHDSLTRYSPYQKLFLKRFSPIDLIMAVIGTCMSTLFILCIMTRCFPVCCRVKHKYFLTQPKHKIWKNSCTKVFNEASDTKPYYKYLPFSQFFKRNENRKFQDPLNKLTLNEKMSTEEQQNISQIVDRSSNQYGQSMSVDKKLFSSALFPFINTGNNNAGYWPSQEFNYSPNMSHEYDIPGSFDPLSGAMPSVLPYNSTANKKPPFNSISQQASLTLTRRGLTRPATGFHLNASDASQLPLHMYPNGLVFPSVVANSPLNNVSASRATMIFGKSADTSPFLSCQQFQGRSHSQLLTAPSYFGSSVMMTPNIFQSYHPGAFYAYQPNDFNLVNLQSNNNISDQLEEVQSTSMVFPGMDKDQKVLSSESKVHEDNPEQPLLDEDLQQNCRFIGTEKRIFEQDRSISKQRRMD